MQRTLAVYRSILGFLVIFLMLWPLMHYQLVIRYALNPWKCFGAAMYCTVSWTTLEILEVHRGGFRNIPLDSFETRAPAYFVEEYGQELHCLGLLAGPPPISIASAIFQERTDLRDVLIRIRGMRLDPETAMIRPDLKSVYHFRREGNQVKLYDSDIKSQLISRGEDSTD